MALSPRSGWLLSPFRDNRVYPRPYEDVSSGTSMPNSAYATAVDEPASSRMVSRAASNVEVEVQAAHPEISYSRLLTFFVALLLIVLVRAMDVVERGSTFQTASSEILLKISVSVQTAFIAISLLLVAIMQQLEPSHTLRFRLASAGCAIAGILASSQIGTDHLSSKWPLYSIVTIFGCISTSMNVRFRYFLTITIVTDAIYILLLLLDNSFWHEKITSSILLVVMSFLFGHSSFQNEVFRKAEVTYIKRIQRENRQLQKKLKKESVAINTPLDRIMSKLNMALKSCDGDLAQDLEEVIRLLGAHAEALLQPALPVLADRSAAKYLEFASGPATLRKRKLISKVSRASNGAARIDHSDSDAAHVDISLTDWNLNYLEIDAGTDGRAILLLAEATFARHNLFSDLKIDQVTFRSFFKQLQKKYHPEVIYHNSSHGADVCHSFYYIISTGDMVRFLQPVEIMAAIIACLGHDVAHPGYNNAFMINTRSPEAMLYNDRTVLENMHAAEVFRIASSEDSNIFQSLTKDQYKTARSIIIEMILATDLARHFEILSAFNAKLSSTTSEHKWVGSDVVSTLQVAIKIADLAHFAKERDLHLRWNDLVLEEFYKQGDEEVALELDVSPLMDRRLREGLLSQNQVGFIDYIVRPLFIAGLNVFPSLQPLITQLEANFSYWKTFQQENVVTIPIEASKSSTDCSTSSP